MKLIVRKILDQSVFVNLVIAYIVSQILVLLFLPRFFEEQLDDFDRFVANSNVWEIVEEFDNHKLYDFVIKFHKKNGEVVYRAPLIDIPLDKALKDKLSADPFQSLQYFFVVCADSSCYNKSSLFYLLESGDIAVFSPTGVKIIDLLDPRILLSSEGELSSATFIDILKISTLALFAMKTSKIVLLESTFILSGFILGSSFLIFILLASLLVSALVWCCSFFVIKEPFPNIFTLVNLVAVFAFFIYVSIIEILNLEFVLSSFLKVIAVSGLLSYTLLFLYGRRS
ncbi:MAG: hypothetical protein NZO16_01105 [Deltaproteobacteria bacterium]|nr:hypothetical protein [Deltaproteobacteria bacterium]